MKVREEMKRIGFEDPIYIAIERKRQRSTNGGKVEVIFIYLLYNLLPNKFYKEKLKIRK